MQGVLVCVAMYRMNPPKFNVTTIDDRHYCLFDSTAPADSVCKIQGAKKPTCVGLCKIFCSVTYPKPK